MSITGLIACSAGRSRKLNGSLRDYAQRDERYWRNDRGSDSGIWIGVVIGILISCALGSMLFYALFHLDEIAYVDPEPAAYAEDW